MKTCNYPGCNYPAWGGGYCKRHQWARKDKKVKGFKPRKKTGEKALFEQIWKDRPHVSELTGRSLQEFQGTRLFFSLFAHIKPKGRFPELRLDPGNIVLLHPEEHRLLDQGTEAQRLAYAEEWGCDWKCLNK